MTISTTCTSVLHQKKNISHHTRFHNALQRNNEPKRWGKDEILVCILQASCSKLQLQYINNHNFMTSVLISSVFQPSHLTSYHHLTWEHPVLEAPVDSSRIWIHLEAIKIKIRNREKKGGKHTNFQTKKKIIDNKRRKKDKSIGITTWPRSHKSLITWNTTTMQNVIHYTEDPKPCAVSGISGGALIK